MKVTEIPFRILCGIGIHLRTVRHHGGDGRVCEICHYHFTVAEIQAEMHAGAMTI